MRVVAADVEHELPAMSPACTLGRLGREIAQHRAVEPGAIAVVVPYISGGQSLSAEIEDRPAALASIRCSPHTSAMALDPEDVRLSEVRERASKPRSV